MTVRLAVFPFAYPTSQEVQDQLWTDYIKAMFCNEVCFSGLCY